MKTQLPTLLGKQFNFWVILWKASLFPWQFRQVLWKWILVCGVLVGLTDYTFEVLLSLFPEQGEGFLLEFFQLGLVGLQVALFAFLYAFFCIRCHRLVLLGCSRETETFTFQFGERESNYLRFLIVTFFIIFLSSLLIIPFIGGILVFILSTLLGLSPSSYEKWLNVPYFEICFAYLLGRFGMVFPATAIDLLPTLKWAWRESKAFAGRLGILAGILPLLFSYVYKEGPLLFGITLYPLVYSILTSSLSFICSAIAVAVLSYAFRELTESKTTTSPK